MLLDVLAVFTFVLQIYNILSILLLMDTSDILVFYIMNTVTMNILLKVFLWTCFHLR